MAKSFQDLYKRYSHTQIWQESATSSARKHLEGLKEVLNTGIKKNNFSLKPLSQMTKLIRQRRGLALSNSPFVGNKKGNVVDMVKHLEIVKDGNKWLLRPDNTFAVNRAPSGKVYRISWKRLWTIHEFSGAKISITNKMRTAFNAWWKIVLGHGSFTIPARGVLQKAYNRYIKSEQFKKTNSKMAFDIKRKLES